MAILTQFSSTSAVAVRPASHPELSMPSQAARAQRPDLRIILLADQRRADLPAVVGAKPGAYNSITSTDTIACCASRMRGVVADKGATGSSVRNGAFVTSLGIRPPSPPV